jgi:hypothetical protein
MYGTAPIAESLALVSNARWSLSLGYAIMSGLIKDCINLSKAFWQISNEINGLTYFVNSVNILTKREKPFIKSR